MRQQTQYKSLKRSAEMLRKKGQGGDSVLAHISPEEAKYMQQHFGNDINPHTGLPQFGFFNKLFKTVTHPVKALAPVEKLLRKPVKAIAPVVGSVVGGMLGGPGGAVAGGSLGGALKSRHNVLRNALKGGAIGLGHSLLSPMIGKGLGLDPSSMFGKASMMGAPGWGETMGGMGGLGSMFGGGASSAAEGAGAAAGTGSAGGGLFGMGLLDTGLLAATIAGPLLSKNKKPPLGSPENETLDQAMHKNKPSWGPEHAYRPHVDNTPPAKFPPKGYRKTAWKFFPTPEEQEAQLLAVEQEMAEPGYDRRYAKGGQVKGYYHGSDSGISDKIPVDLPEDAYIMNATDISLLGDGNSLHGAKKMRGFLDSFQKSGITRDEGGHSNVRALVSDAEMKVEPHEVKALGGGSIKKGVKKLDKFRNNLRKHKGVKKILPPKSKPLDQYLR